MPSARQGSIVFDHCSDTHAVRGASGSHASSALGDEMWSMLLRTERQSKSLSVDLRQWLRTVRMTARFEILCHTDIGAERSKA
eukprot:2873536-Amphidinium_carterae.1